MELMGDVVSWLTDPDNWSGRRGIWQRLVEHVQMSGWAILAACLLSLPLAVYLGHRRRFGTLAVNVSNVGRAVPSFAIIVIGTQLYGLRQWPLVGSMTTFVALVALAVPPLVTNTYVAVAEVPDDLRDSARGMGMSGRQVLRRVELPVAVPLLMAGVRTAAVQVVATATIAAFVGAGGLGRFIIDGNAVRDDVRIVGGAVLVATLCLLTDGVLALAQAVLTPRGLRGEREVSTGEDAAATATMAL
jgi:osmoprotectant transport system permease protein